MNSFVHSLRAGQFVLLVMLLADRPLLAQLDESCTATVNGQAVQVDSDGSFAISNIAAADLFGPGGPGTSPDFLSDDYLRVLGVCTAEGQGSVYFQSECFRITVNQSFNVGELFFSEEPPLSIDRVRVIPTSPTLTAVGQTTDIEVTATLTSGKEVPLYSDNACLTFRTSNPSIARVDQQGVVTAVGAGRALITLSVEALAAVTTVTVSLGDPLTTAVGFMQFEDGTPAEGADVELVNSSGQATTGPDGRFEISGVPALLGSITALASVQSGGTLFFGRSAEVLPMPGGITDLGIITLVDDFHWISSTGGSWHDPSNWNWGVAPGPGNDVFIDAEGTYTVTLSDDDAFADSLWIGAGEGTQTLQITNNQALTVSEPGVIQPTAALNLGAGSMTLNGPKTTLLNHGRLTATRLSAIGGNGTIHNSVSGTLRVEAGPGNTHAVLTVAQGFINDGLIELITVGTTHNATLIVTNGVLVNADRIDILPGTGGARTINARLDNPGVIHVSHPLTLANDGRTFTSATGTLNVGDGDTLSIDRGTTVLGSGTQLQGTGMINWIGNPNTVMLDSNLTHPATGAGPRFVFDGTVTVNGPGTLTNEGSLTLSADVFNAPLINPAALTVNRVSAINSPVGAFIQSGTLRVEGGPGNLSAVLTVANGFTNDGLIELINTLSNQGSTLTVTNGTMINADRIDILPGTGGPRTLNATLDNQGAIHVSHPLTLANDGRTFTSATGTLNVDNGDTLSIDRGTTVLGSGTVLQGTGTINWIGNPCTIVLESDLTHPAAGAGPRFVFDGTVTVDGPGTLTNQGSLTLSADIFNAPLINPAALTVNRVSAINSPVGAFIQSGTLRVEGGPGNLSAVLTVANGFTNDGLIELINTMSNQGSTLTVTNGTMINADRIDILPGTGGPRTINARLDNPGVIHVSHPLTLANDGRTFTSATGTLNVDDGDTLSIDRGTTVLGSGTQLQGTGMINWIGNPNTVMLDSNLTHPATGAGPRFVFDGTVTVNGPGTLTNEGSLTLSADVFNAPLINPAALTVNRVSAINSPVGAFIQSGTLRVEGGPGNLSAVLTVANGFTNDGLIELINTMSNQGSTLIVTNGVLVNADRIDILPGTGGARTINARLDNPGVIHVSHPLTLANNGRTFTSTTGTLNVDDGDTLSIDRGTTRLGSGTSLQGTGTINWIGAPCTLTLDSDLTHPATGAGPRFVFDGTVTVDGPGTLTNQGSLTLSADVFNAPLINPAALTVNRVSAINSPVGAFIQSGTLRVEGGPGNLSAVLTVANGFTNDGLIELINTMSNQGSTLIVTNGVLVNADRIDILPGTGGARTLAAEIHNEQSLNVLHPLTINKPSALHVNSGFIDADRSVTVQQSADGRFTNAPSGTIDIASGEVFTVDGGCCVNEGAITGTFSCSTCP